MTYFITANKNKFEEVKSMLGLPIEQLSIDLPEIQSLEAEEIIRLKLLAAQEHATGQYIVEDTSLYLDALEGKLPGPFIKWFLEVLKPAGIARLVAQMGNDNAIAKTIVGYCDENGEMHFFTGVQKGTIVAPRGEKDFGWGPIFQPEGETRTFGEMDKEEKFQASMRALAVKQLKVFLVSSGSIHD